ncbi:MAG: DUF2125 domain-containing protein [Rhodobacter sp.]|nr:DUF2125 domain-containing protein [Rhodobacter sp.]
MRILVVIVVIAAAGWSGFWWVGAQRVDAGLRDWLEARADAGWVADYGAVTTEGFPNRFDTTITALELADPATGVAWSTPFLQLKRLSYQPNHVIATWPETQTLASPYQRLTLGTGRMQASFVFVPGTPQQLDRASFVLDALQVTSTKGWSATIDELRFATRSTAARANSHDIGFEAKALRPEGVFLAELAEAGFVPGTFERLKIDATLGFDAPWDRTAIETARPAITDIELNLLQANWGKLELWMAGDLTVDAAGVASGQITVKAKNWREMLQLAVSAGWVPGNFAPTLETGLELLAALSGSPKTLDAPLTIRNGTVSFGPVTLGQAPKLRLR